ncbi:MAG: MFS transporter, partial [Chloroflexi bacterium]
LPPSSMAVVFAPAGVGLVVGSLFMPRIARRLGKSRTVFIGTISLAITVTLLPLLSLLTYLLQQHGIDFKPIQFLIAPIVMFAAGFEIDFINIPAQTAIQEHTPDWIKGRVLALQLMLYSAVSIPIILGIGVIADAFGIANVIYLVALCMLGFGLWGRYYERKPHKWTTRQTETEDADDIPEAEQSEQDEESNVQSIK